MKTTQKLLGYVLPYLLALTVTPGCGPDRQATAEQERKTEIAMKARALYEEKCKTVAGEKIYRTVPDVEGIVLLKVRPVPGAKEWADLMWPGAVFADESRATNISRRFWLRAFIHAKRRLIKDRAACAGITDTNRTPITDRRPQQATATWTLSTRRSGKRIAIRAQTKRYARKTPPLQMFSWR
ncbi:MAG: hypothetical protein IPP84_15440 [Propionivibrio sp.]|uniref:hypothetical protein n=1 Tax=Propionivibrio sp. TaxID=2212460 RepID=UPI0025F702C2|nr:hypothetical protein [Propionivibrio sp.]MBL0209269.1 hypothetical protein [Propionivibrio sp.]